VEVVRANGLEIAYRRAGQGPPVLLLHGAAGDGSIWQPQLAALADELTVVAWDEPGAAHVAGLSWGGTVALELYRHHPEVVATLILVDTYAGWKGSLPEEEVRARSRTRGSGGGARRSVRSHAPRASPASRRRGSPRSSRRWPPPSAPASMWTQLSVMAAADQRDVLPRIAAPT
jgi:pimeloyl-ACP methyl ester carboxylesterase